MSIGYQGDMPLLYFSDKGWIIQREQTVDLWLKQWSGWVEEGKLPEDMPYLKNNSRETVLLFLKKNCGDRQ